MLLNVVNVALDPHLLLYLAHVIPLAVILSTFLHAVAISRKHPTNVVLGGYRLLWGKWLSTWDFLLHGSDTIYETYRQAKGAAFAILAVGEYQVLVSQPQQVQELSLCPKHTMSFPAAMNDRLSYKQIMYGFEHNDIDPDDAVPIQALKVLLRKNLPALGPIIQQRLQEATQDFLGKAGYHSTGPVTVSVFSLAKAISARVNNQILFGEDLTTNPKFESDTIRYAWDGAITMEICRLLPKPIAKVIGVLLMARTGAMDRVGRAVKDLIHRRITAASERPDEQYESEQHLDCTQFVITASRTPRQRTLERLTQQMVALLFASAHQLPMAMAWAIIMLGEHRHLIKLLRDEIEEVESQGHANPIKEMRILDSFLRESSRLNPLDALSVQRKALKSFTFSNGVHVPAGNLVAVPQHALMRDANNYAAPDSFDPFRFYSAKGSDCAAPKYTDVNWKYPFWGSPTQSCPGRWYAADLLKYALVHLLKTYDFELASPDASKPLIWTTAIVPSFSAKMTLRPRKGTPV